MAQCNLIDKAGRELIELGIVRENDSTNMSPKRHKAFEMWEANYRKQWNEQFPDAAIPDGEFFATIDVRTESELVTKNGITTTQSKKIREINVHKNVEEKLNSMRSEDNTAVVDADSVTQGNVLDGAAKLGYTDVEKLAMDFSNMEESINYLIAESGQVLSDIDAKMKATDDPHTLIALQEKKTLVSERRDQLFKSRNQIKGDPSSLNFKWLMFQKDIELDYVSNMLTKNPDARQLMECKSSLEFWRRLGDFSSNREHIIWSANELYSDGQLTLAPEIQRQLQAVSYRAEALQRKVNELETKMVSDMLATDSRFEPLVGEIKGDTAEERQAYIRQQLEKKMFNRVPMRDISLFDRWTMDPSALTFGEDSPLAQKMMLDLMDTTNEYASRGNQLIQRLANGRMEVEQILRSMGYTLPGSRTRGADWTIFRAVDEFGNVTDKLREHFTYKWNDRLHELDNEFTNTMRSLATADKGKRMGIKRRLWEKRRSWIDANAIIIDPRRIQELFTDSSIASVFEGESVSSDAAYVNRLKELLGENGYRKTVELARRRLLEYYAAQQVKYNAMETAMNIEDALSYSDDNLAIYQAWVRDNNPFRAIDNYVDGTKDFTSTLDFNNIIPKKEGADGKSTGYYDEVFSKIEANEKLYEYYNAMRETIDFSVSNLPSSMSEMMFRGDIPSIRQSANEVFLQSDLPWFARLHLAGKKLFENIKSFFGEDNQIPFSYNLNDPATGRSAIEINSSWLKSHQRNIQGDLRVAMIKLRHYAEGQSIQGRIDLTKMSDDFLSAFASLIGSGSSLESIRTKLNGADITSIDVKKAISSGLIAARVANDTKDMPRILQVFAAQSAAYGAKREASNRIAIMKEMYSKIPKARTTNSGEKIRSVYSLNRKNNDAILSSNDNRSNAIARMNDWFDRVVQNISTHEDDFGGSRPNEKGTSKAAGAVSKFFDRGFNPILTAEEKRTRKEMRELIDVLKKDIEKYGDDVPEKLQNEYNTIVDDLNFLERRDQTLGKQVSLISVYRAMMRMCHVRGLGWNLKAAGMNFLQGQLANSITAMQEKYYTSDDFFRAANIVKGNNLKWLTFGKIKVGQADKVTMWMRRTNLLQDSSNELQKSSLRSSMSNYKAKLNPYYWTKSAEFINQAPLALAILMGTEITGKDGTKSNVWDAMKSDGTLIENFDTKSNRENWVYGRGEEFNNYISKTTEVISLLHGNYHEMLGMSASKYALTSSMMMFKRWLPNFVRQRIGVERYNPMTGQTEKGFLRSLTAGSGSALFGTMGLLTGGPLVGAIGMGVGGFIGKKFGVVSDISYMKDLTTFLKNSVTMTIGKPINMIRPGTIHMESNEKMLTKYGKDGYIDSKGNRKSGFKLVDANNQRALAAEVGMVALTVLLKMLFGAVTARKDDDEDDDTKRKKEAIFNYSFNILNEIQSQSFMVANPNILTKQLTPAMYTYCQNIGKLTDALWQTIEGNGRYSAGVNAGQSKLWVTGKKFLPTFADGYMGALSSSQRIYERDYVSNLFRSDEDIQAEIRAARRAMLRAQFIEEDKSLKNNKKKLNKMVDKATKDLRKK